MARAVSRPGWVLAVAAALWVVSVSARAVWRYRGTVGVVVGLLILRAMIGVTALAVILAVAGVVAGVWRWRHRPSFDRWVGDSISRACRRGSYRRRWRWLMFGHNLTEREEGIYTSARQAHEVNAPKLCRIRCGRWVDHLTVRPLAGQSVDDWDRACEALALALGARDCRVAIDGPGLLRVDVFWGDPLATAISALPLADTVDLAAVPVGVREDGTPWTVRLTSNHLLVAGVTGAGKSSVLWSMIRGVAPGVADGVVDLWGVDPKGGMELLPGRPLFAAIAAGRTDDMVDLLDQAVGLVEDRAARYATAGVRAHTPGRGEPLVVVVVDELAFLTAYLPDRKAREAINQSLATLLTQGRAVGVCVVAALQDPRKEVIGYRNLFPTKIGLRLDERSQVDMILGDGARNAGARCDRIPDATPGVAYVKVDGQREPVRVRAAYVTDADIAATAATYPAPTVIRPAA